MTECTLPLTDCGVFVPADLWRDCWGDVRRVLYGIPDSSHDLGVDIGQNGGEQQSMEIWKLMLLVMVRM